MRYVRLGHSGLKVSRLCLGMMSFGDGKERAWTLQEDAALPLVKRAFDGGITFFDTADVYSGGESERITGRVMRRLGLRREGIVVATKVFNPMGEGPNDRGLSRKHLMDSIDASLARLGMDYVDLYQIHRLDHETPIEETLDALSEIVRSGKARYIGASSMFAWQFAKALYTADQRGDVRFVSMQDHYNLVYREEEREMIPLCIDQGIGIMPWSPMARGFFAANRSRGGGGETARAKSDPFAEKLYFRDEDFAVADRAWEVAKERGASASQMALSWLLGKPYVTAPIVGATKIEHLDQALAAEEFVLTPEEVRRLEEPYRPHPILGHS